MICKNCNKKIKDGSLFCPHCGMLPSTSSNSTNENVVKKENPFKNEKLQKHVHIILPLLSVTVILLWFCKTISLDAGSTSGLYSVDMPLFILLKGVALLAVAFAAVSLAVRILIIVKKDKRSIILYSVSAASDAVSLGCIIFKLLDVRATVAGGAWENLTSAQFGLNALGWVFVIVCAISIMLHLMLILNKGERKI